MSSLNRTFLMGNLTRDPELKYTPQGTPVCRLGIAVNRKFKQGDAWKTDVQFFNVVVWGKTGENCREYLVKGRPVFVEGRLQNRSWEKDGVKHTMTEIVADSVQFIGGKPAGDRAPDAQAEEQPPESNDEIPF